jgi:hypothetical protein
MISQDQEASLAPALLKYIIGRDVVLFYFSEMGYELWILRK